MQIKTGVVEIIFLMISIFETLLTAFVASVFFFWPRKYKNISGDVILITGGGKGIGRLIAVEFTKRKPKQVFSNIKYKTSMTDIDSFVFCMKHSLCLNAETSDWKSMHYWPLSFLRCHHHHHRHFWTQEKLLYAQILVITVSDLLCN